MLEVQVSPARQLLYYPTEGPSVGRALQSVVDEQARVQVVVDEVQVVSLVRLSRHPVEQSRASSR